MTSNQNTTQNQYVVFSPKTWLELVDNKELVCKNAIGRKPKNQYKYLSDMQSISREVFLQKIYDKMNGNKICLMKNDYPYTSILQYLPDVSQIILWSKDKMSNIEIDNYLIKNLDSKDYFWFEQPEFRKTVPEIFHIHIFIRNFTKNV